MYKAKVVKLSVKKHPNADNIQLGYVQGVQVIVGNDVAEGAIGVFFNQDGQLSEEFLKTNNLYRHSTLNTDTSKSGFFEDNGRVRAIKLRGERSDGFFCTMDMLAYTGYNVNKLQLGEEFDELNGHKICQKYYTPATSRAIATNNRAKLTQANYMLPRHFDTEQLKYNLDKIDVGDIVVITEKCHGCVDRKTIINTLEYGDIEISKIVENKLKCNVMSYDIYKDEIVFSEVQDWYFFENDSDWYELELDSGNKIVITGNNPVWLPDIMCYRNVENLVVGDRLAII